MCKQNSLPKPFIFVSFCLLEEMSKNSPADQNLYVSFDYYIALYYFSNVSVNNIFYQSEAKKMYCSNTYPYVLLFLLKLRFLFFFN